MSSAEIIRAWKDPQYRSTLSVVPIHPAGQIEVLDPALGGAAVNARGFRHESVRHAGTTLICGHTVVLCHTIALTSQHCCT